MKVKKEYLDNEFLVDIQSLKEEDNNRAFTFLYRKYFQPFLYFVRSNQGLEEEAKDIFQEGIIIFYKKAKQPTIPIEYPFTFFFSICKNLWMEKARQKTNRERILKEITNLNDYHDDLDATLEEDKNKMVLVLLEKLGKGCQEILLSFYYEKRNMKEIAERMGLASEAVAKNKKMNCMNKLKDVILTNRNYLDVLK
ncbi:MAG: sigma-70 family RNA polymerase sigma factor [Bacteroidota bacterium]